MIKIAPSLLSADVSCLGDEIQRLEKAGADMLHFDVMDGHFVPNLTFGPHILKGLKKRTNLPFDVHLMVNNPETVVPWFIEAGADIITFHLEACPEPLRLIELIHQHGKKAGLSTRPDTDVKLLEAYGKSVDLILVMGVEPGFGGQAFRADTPHRIFATKQIAGDFLIAVDGGVNFETAPDCIQAGADILVAGTAVFKNNAYADNIRKLKGE
ncbi:MAG: ribulose-phosphate 3-epimerase [Alphaproteobacteria bacterium]|nr:ribulose-phosphate 3-epimerase [Alphaproteobacteria bacterium]